MTEHTAQQPRTGNAARRRRGSALLVVIGALAITSVFAAIYLSIGQTDRRLADSIDRQDGVRSVRDTVGRYLAQVIARDRFDTFVERNSAAGNNRLRRENTDAPYTDFTRRSVINNYRPGLPASEAQRFQPNGTHRFPNQTGFAGAEFTVPHDPWLASTAPEYVNFGGTQGDGSDAYGRVYSRLRSLGPNDRTYDYLDRRDWRQISNFAPDGRFVNLYALRDPAGGGPPNGDGFDAAPGINVVSDAPDLSGPETSALLSLLEARANGRIQATVQLPFGLGNIGTGINSALNTPAWFTMYQKHMLMPDDPGFQIFDQGGNIAGPDSPDFPDYQYADADGDGLYDSRWFELVDATDNRADRAVDLLPGEDLRWFVAARAIDLSALVNVNTATDHLAASAETAPPGASPAEVSLRRVLTAEDPSLEFLAEPTHPGLGRNGLFTALSLSHIQPPETLQFEANQGVIAASDYTEFGVPDWRLQPQAISAASPQVLGGRFAYDAIRRAISGTTSMAEGNSQVGLNISYERLAGTTTPPTTLNQLRFALGDASPIEWGLMSEFNPNSGTRRFRTPVPGLPGAAPKSPALEATDRLRYYRAIASTPGRDSTLAGLQLQAPPPPNQSGTQVSTPGTNLFDLGDLAELLTFHGVNDDSNLSRLERVTLGRLNLDNRFNSFTLTQLEGGTFRYSPLRSTRDTDLERRRHDDQIDNNATYEDPPVPTGDGVLDSESLALLTMDRRRLLTTRSGATPVRSRVIPLDATNRPIDEGLFAADQPLNLEGLLNNPAGAFNHYARALMPGSFRPGNNAADWTNTPQTNTLYYGHRGPELALRAAAHAAVNLKDAQDRDTEPTIATVIADQSLLNSRFDTQNPPDTAALLKAEPFHFWFTGTGALDLRSAALTDSDPTNAANDNDPTTPAPAGMPPEPLSNGALDQSRQVANVYGIEPHPIITEASVVAVYSDVPNNPTFDEEQAFPQGTFATFIANGFMWPQDRLELQNDPMGLYAPDYNPANNAATVNFTRDAANNDLLFYALAVQLHNPFDRPVNLGVQNNADTMPPSEFAGRFDYYLEFNGRFFPAAQLVDPAGTAVLPPLPTGLARAIDDGMGSGPQVQGLTLQPGQSRVLYYTAHQDLSALDGQWASAAGDLGVTTTMGSPLETFIASNLGSTLNSLDPNGQPAARTALYNPRTNEFVNPGFDDFLDSPVSLPPNAVIRPDAVDRNATENEVRLWRSVVAEGLPGATQNDNEPRFGDNARPLWIENDQLVDRLVVPNGFSALMPAEEDRDIADTIALDGDIGNAISPDTARRGNFGLTVVDHISARRATASPADVPVDNTPDPTNFATPDPTDTTDLGAVPLWLLQRANGSTNEFVAAGDTASDPGNASTLADFAASGIDSFMDNRADVRYHNFNEFLNALQASRIQIGTLNEPPHAKSAQNNGQRAPAAEIYGNAGTPFQTPDGTPLNEILALLALPNNDLRNPASGLSTARLTDLLKPMAAGPAFSLNTLTASPLNMNEARWVTTAEALTAALGLEDTGYYTRPPTDPNFVPYFSDLVDTSVTPNEYILDAGALRIDRYAPYFDLGAVGFNPADDIPVHPAIPMALRVLDGVDGLELATRAQTATPPVAAVGSDPYNARFNEGLVNINTAPIDVLRALPGLSPSLLNSLTGEPEQWSARVIGTPSPQPSANDLNTHRMETSGFGAHMAAPITITGLTNAFATRPDLAAVLKGYRDRDRSPIREGSDPGTGVMNFRPTPTDVTRLFFESNFINRAAANPLAIANFPSARGREAIAGVEGIRGTPGFASVAEVLAANAMTEDRAADLGIAPLELQQSRHLAMDRLGRDVDTADPTAPGGQPLAAAAFPQGAASGDRSALTTARVADPVNPDEALLDEIPNDIAERLAVAEGLLNTITVRSDIYAVWFRLRGYAREDVEGLSPADLMTPSVERRYLMIIDRSTVVEPGQPPEILLFNEVPL